MRGVSEYTGSGQQQQHLLQRSTSYGYEQDGNGGNNGDGGNNGGIGSNLSAENELLVRLRNHDCLCVLDQASGVVGMFVQTLVERTSGVRFLLTTTQRSLANEHSVSLRGLTPESAMRMFIRRCPRENLSIGELPPTLDAMVRKDDMRGRLRCALQEANVLSPGAVMRVCARMRDPHGKTFCESLKAEKVEEERE
jgi:hypothetical protein